MRILLANDGLSDAGGVNTYLRALCPELLGRGHAVAWLHCDARLPADVPVADCWSAAGGGIDAALAAAAAWRPDVCFSHNMHALAVERALFGIAPVVKMMHGYFGTCVSGTKSFAWPARRPCDRRFGAGCLACYLPRRCGQMRPLRMIEQFRWASQQRALFHRYHAIVVASAHMRREYASSGAAAERVYTIPYFVHPAACRPAVATVGQTVLFMGRMTPLKGGDLLVRAVAKAKSISTSRLSLVMAGDGPQRPRWAALARSLGVDAHFPGWVEGDARREIIERATVLVVPSTWPEPFGMVGLEAGACRVPSVAFDVGGIREWLRDGRNGLLAGETPAVAPLAAAIARVITDRDLAARLSAGAHATALEFSAERHLASLEPLLTDATAAAGAPA